MKCVAGGILVGLLFSVAVMLGGTELAAALAIVLALVAIAVGLSDWLRTHG